MLKIHANVSKKVPIPNLDYSSQQYMAGLELEVGDGATPEQIQERIRQVYGLLESSIDAQIATATATAIPVDPHPVAQPVPVNRIAGKPGNGGLRSNGNGNGHASQAQVKAIFAISKAIGFDRAQLLSEVTANYNVDKPEALSIKQASSLIESLKSRQSV